MGEIRQYEGMMTLEPRTHDDYTVGWICPLEIEQIAALEMLDEEHERLAQPPADHNVYNLGRIADHNVVIAGLHHPGNNPAATVVTQMRMTFPSLRFGLLVGIGGGVPVRTDCGMVRLGDVVVSKPAGIHSGAVQYDHGTARYGKFERTGALAPPPVVLLNAAQDLAAKRARSRQDPIAENIKRIDTSIRGLQKYKHPGSSQDYLFPSEYTHTQIGMPCSESGCDISQCIQRPDGDEDEVYTVVHRGTVASGELAVQNANIRDALANEHQIICFDTEAAGALVDFPCMIIRGVSHYCDSHENDQWHGYAAAVAAAYARQLFFHMPISEVKRCISQSAERDIKSIKQWQEDNRFGEILNWLTPIEYGKQQTDYLRRRQPGTVQWLIDSNEYHTWLERTPQTLFCPGIPGAGKTILTSIVIHDLESRFHNDTKIGIAYIYCNFNLHAEQQIEDLVSSLLKQLARSAPSLPPTVQDLYDRHAQKKTKPMLNDICDVLHSVVNIYTKIFVVVDALDECQVSDNCRARFLSELFNLQDKGSNVNIFATSRNIPEINRVFEKSLVVEVRATEIDIRRYIEGHICELPRFVNTKPKLKKDIIETITQAADGMFLLVQLYFYSLVGKVTAKKIRIRLQELTAGSGSYNLAYEDAMVRIEGQRKDQKECAKQILAWITCAKKPLTQGELQHALAVELEKPELDKDNIAEIEDMISFCAGLVTIDKESSIIRLVHYTTQEYFEATQERWFPCAEREITKICTTYLSFQAFTNGWCQTDKEFEERLQQHHLYSYAAQNWGHHARMAPDVREVLLFLQKDTQVLASSQALLAVKKYPNHINYSQQVPKHMTGLHLAAYFGLERIIGPLMDKESLELKDSHNRTPLWWATINGHMGVMRLLLENGANTEVKDTSGQTLLLWALTKELEDVTQLLLEKGADPEAKDTFGQTRGRTALWLAVGKENEALLSLLFKHGVNTEVKNQGDQSLLEWAVKKGNQKILRLLLQEGTNPVVKKSFGQTLLVAAYWGNEVLVKMLLGAGEFNVNVKDKDSRTPLSWAAERGHDNVVKLLLGARKVNVNSKDKSGQTPLAWAAKNGQKAVVELLLQTQNVEVDAMDNEGRTPLSLSTENGHEAVVELLVRTGKFDLNMKGSLDQTVLSWAAENGCDTIIELLLKTDNIDVDVRDSLGHTPLSLAAKNGHRTAVKLLLETGKVDANAKGFIEQMPLSLAAQNGHEAIVQLLLQTENIDINARDQDGQAPLLISAKKGHASIVHLLLGMEKVDVNTKDTKGQTPLSLAVKNWHEAVVKLLLGIDKVDANTKDMDGHTPLSMAAKCRHEVIIKLLLDTRKIDVDLSNGNIRTLLPWAAERGHEAIVKLLLQVKNIDMNAIAYDGQTPLSLSAKNGHATVVKWLLETEKVDVNIADKDEQTPLSLAAKNRHDAVVELLFDSGKVDVDIRDDDGQTLLSWAAENGYGAIIKLLLKGNKADVSVKAPDGQKPPPKAVRNRHKAIFKLLFGTGKAGVEPTDIGWTPLIWATKNGYETIFRGSSKSGKVKMGIKNRDGRVLLVKAVEKGREAIFNLLFQTGKVDIDSKDYSGRTPLAWASKRGHVGVVKLLLETGNADVNSRNNNGWTSLSWAAGNGHEAVVKLLLEIGKIDVNSKDHNGWTPLSWAAGNGREAVIKLLLETGKVDINSKDNNGWTALTWAAESGHDGVVKLLLETGGFDINSQDNTGWTALQWASENGHDAVIKLLEAGKIDEDTSPETGIEAKIVEVG